jgi:hypothetical protein
MSLLQHFDFTLELSCKISSTNLNNLFLDKRPEKDTSHPLKGILLFTFSLI